METLKNRLPILDIWVDPVTMHQSLDLVRSTLRNGHRPHSIFSVNPEKTFSVPRDHVLHETFRTSDLLIPDGIGVVLAARLLYGASLSRVPGVELMLNICRLAADENHSIFIYGSKEEVNAKAVEELRKRFPKLHIAGRSNGYIKKDGVKDLVMKINDSGAKILFLALGSPMQEKWYSDYRARLTHVKICQGIGGTLDTIAGNVKRAPEIWQECSAEWLYRLLSEPKRIKRQKLLPLFAMKVLVARVQFLLNSSSSENRKS
jgi:N-acetylglucosaminyldiphosphoundecaprenol N-acetyl-beta-D-mannosaminyltransferase